MRIWAPLSKLLLLFVKSSLRRKIFFNKLPDFLWGFTRGWENVVMHVSEWLIFKRQTYWSTIRTALSLIMLLDAVSMCVTVKKKKKIPCLSRIWASTHLKWCSCFIPWLSLDWNVSINICVLFFSIRPSSSHEKHVRVSWITMAAEHVYFRHHPLFLLSLVFLFSVVTQAALPLT